MSPIRPLCGIYKSAPRWRKSANDGSKTSCALPHRSRGQVSVGFHGIKSKKINGQSNIVSRRPRRLAYGRRIRCMRRRVIVDLASAGPLEVKFIITLRRSTPVIEYRRFELGPPGESKLPLSNRKYTDFLKILNNKNFYKFLDFYRRFRVLLHYE